MKYKILAYSLDSLQKKNVVKLLFKGALYCRPNNKKGFWVFPWNVNALEIAVPDAFPVKFWGLRGTRLFSSHEITHDVKVWNPDTHWQHTITTNLSSIPTENIIRKFQINVPLNLTEMNGLTSHSIEIKKTDLSFLQQTHIPESICTIPKN